MEKVSTLIHNCDFMDENNIKEFLYTIVQRIKFIDNDIDGTQEQVVLDGLLKKGKTLNGLYAFIFNMKYIKSEYSLKLDDRDLYQLSPGERGALLLIFYLLLDKSDVPLIIDQPEENLDNESIYKLLVPVIKEARNRKQIIMVTHNPNLAVVCDSDQIICADKDINRNSVIQYSLGSIENQDIRKKIVDILEGTEPAFKKRDKKYSLQ
jgi:ABC-type lipoprotein export system ATPase subunit